MAGKRGSHHNKAALRQSMAARAERSASVGPGHWRINTNRNRRPASTACRRLGLLSRMAIIRMPPLVLNHCNSDSLWIHAPEINDIRKPLHETPANVRRGHHPSLGPRRQFQHLSLELIGEPHTQTGRSILVIALDRFQLGLDGRVVLNAHRRSRDINSS